MRAGIHPIYKATKIVCVCGNVIDTRSTNEKEELHIEICGVCHPFYSGKQKFVDAAGRVDRYVKKYGASSAKKTTAVDTAVSVEKK